MTDPRPTIHDYRVRAARAEDERDAALEGRDEFRRERDAWKNACVVALRTAARVWVLEAAARAVNGCIVWSDTLGHWQLAPDRGPALVEKLNALGAALAGAPPTPEDNAPPVLEEKMEAADLPESDRDEVRRFAEFLCRRKAVSAGEKPPPDPALRKWLAGLDAPPEDAARD